MAADGRTTNTRDGAGGAFACLVLLCLFLSCREGDERTGGGREGGREKEREREREGEREREKERERGREREKERERGRERERERERERGHTEKVLMLVVTSLNTQVLMFVVI